jgi:hypothetical protein
VSRTRRGKLRLPQHFPPEVRALENLTISQVRRSIYRVNSESGHDRAPNRSTVDYIRQVMPGGCVRTVYGCPSVHEWQRKRVKHLSESDWPRLGTRAAWPSTPTVTELLEMSRRGLTPQPIQHVRQPVKDRLSLAQFNSDAGLRKRLIRSNVIGIRADVEVPRQYLDYFSYRWGFLILVVRNFPTGLARFLAGQWIKTPSNLWLQDKCSFKSYLKKTPRACFASRERMIGPW